MDNNELEKLKKEVEWLKERLYATEVARNRFMNECASLKAQIKAMSRVKK
jgi:hypothetical protein